MNKRKRKINSECKQCKSEQKTFPFSYVHPELSNVYRYKINITCTWLHNFFKRKTGSVFSPVLAGYQTTASKCFSYSVPGLFSTNLCATEQEKSATQVRLLQLAFWAWTLAAEGTWLSFNPVLNSWGIWDPFNSQSYHHTPQHITYKVIPTALSTPMNLKLQNISVQAILCPDVKTCTYIILSRKLKIRPNVSFCFIIKYFSRHL